MRKNETYITFFLIILATFSFSQLPEIQWQNTIGGNGIDYLYSVQQTSDGGYILGGYSESNATGDKTENSIGNYDYWVIKLNSSGNIGWQNTIGTSSGDILNSIQQTPDGGYIIGGTTTGVSGSTDFWIVKLNSIGNTQWDNIIGGDSQEGTPSICQTTDGGYILGGFSYSGISGDKTEPNLDAPGGLISSDYWVIKLDTGGNIEWQNTIGGSSNDFLNAVEQTTDGGYILGGFSESTSRAIKQNPAMGAMIIG